MTGPFASLSLYVVRVRLFRSCSTFTKNVTYQNSCSKLRYFSNLHIYLKSISETICYYLLQSLVVRSHYQERQILLSCPCSPAEKNHNCCGTWAQITKSTQASGAIFEETFIERFFPHLKLHFAARWCNQCDYICCVTYYWMETDPDYEFEAPKWFDFTTDFEDELNDDSKWV